MLIKTRTKFLTYTKWPRKQFFQRLLELLDALFEKANEILGHVGQANFQKRQLSERRKEKAAWKRGESCSFLCFFAKACVEWGVCVGACGSLAQFAASLLLSL